MTTQRSDARKRVEQRDEILLSPDDLHDAERDVYAERAWDHEMRRTVLRAALAEVWSGADFTDADAVLDHLADLGGSVEVQT